MRALVDWFFNRFRASNNFRLITFWAIGLAHLIFNLVVFGFGSGLEFGRSEEAQRYYNAFFDGRFATDAELVPWILRPFGWLAGLLSWVWGWLRWASWTLWVLMFIVNIIYIPIAFRDEFSRGWRAGMRSVRERRGSSGAAATSPPPGGGGTAPPGQPQPGPGGFLRELREFFREVAGASLSNLFFHR